MFSGKKKNRKRKLEGQDVSANISKVTNEEGTGQKESTDVPAPRRKRRRRKSTGSCEEKSNEGEKEIKPKEEKINEKCVGYLFTSNSQSESNGLITRLSNVIPTVFKKNVFFYCS